MHRHTLRRAGLFLAIATASPVLGAESLFIEGFSQPNRISKVASATSGILAERSFNRGEEVDQGQCLAQIDASTFNKTVEIAKLRVTSEGELRSALVGQRSRQQRLEILSALAKQNAASPDEISRAETEWDQAKARVIAAREQNLIYVAEYEKLLAQANDYCIKAPFKGVIVEYAKQKGEWIGPVDPHVCTIAELDLLRVDFLVPAPLVGQLSVDAQVQIRFVDTDTIVKGSVAFVAPYADAETNTIEVRVRLENFDRQLAAGTRCQLQLTPQ